MTMIKITHAQIWVHDQDEALAYYTNKVEMEVREDVTLPDLGGFRWLSVEPPSQPDVALVLMLVPGPPVFDEDTAAKVPRSPRREPRAGSSWRPTTARPP